MSAAGSLAGRRIVVTRRPEQASVLVAGLRDLGAEVIELPTVKIAPPCDPRQLEAALERLDSFDVVAFTSANAVRAVQDALEAQGVRSPFGSPNGPRLASVGAATSAALFAAWPSVSLDLEPDSGSGAAGLVEAFRKVGVRGQRVLLPSSDLARDELAAGLVSLGAEVERVEAYRTVTPSDLPEKVGALLREGFDLVVFASPSAVEGFAAAAGVRARGVPAAVIGPTTEQAALRAGFSVRAVASPATAEGLVSAVAAAFGPRGGASRRFPPGSRGSAHS